MPRARSAIRARKLLRRSLALSYVFSLSLNLFNELGTSSDVVIPHPSKASKSERVAAAPQLQARSVCSGATVSSGLPLHSASIVSQGSEASCFRKATDEPPTVDAFSLRQMSSVRGRRLREVYLCQECANFAIEEPVVWQRPQQSSTQRSYR